MFVNNGILVNSVPRILIHVNQVRTSGESLPVVWLSSGLKLASPAVLYDCHTVEFLTL